MNLHANQPHVRGRVGTRSIVCATLLLVSLMIKPAVATPEDEVRSTFDRFVAAQNAHVSKQWNRCCSARRIFSGSHVAHRSGARMRR